MITHLQSGWSPYACPYFPPPRWVRWSCVVPPWQESKCNASLILDLILVPDIRQNSLDSWIHLSAQGVGASLGSSGDTCSMQEQDLPCGFPYSVLESAVASLHMWSFQLHDIKYFSCITWRDASNVTSSTALRTPPHTDSSLARMVYIFHSPCFESSCLFLGILNSSFHCPNSLIAKAVCSFR